MTTIEILSEAKKAVCPLSDLTTNEKNKALLAMADALEENTEFILEENIKDLENAKGKVGDVMLDRLMLNQERILGMAEGIRDVVALPDPVGEIISEEIITSGLKLKKMAVPMGVIAIIYESRPNVTSDAAALCLKSGNVCVLRGGKEAFRTSRAILSAMRKGLKSLNLPETFINMIEDTGRESAFELMQARGFVDLLIPRGGRGLIESCVKNAIVPVIETGTGICSVYVDEDADFNKALDIIENAKTQRPSVCNAEETCLISEKIAKDFLPLLKKTLVEDRLRDGKDAVELRLCPKSAEIIDGKKAVETDFDTEFLDYILAVKIVADVKEAVKHIQQHSTHHSDAIITENTQTAEYYVHHVDSAAVYVNASTRFTDGGMFGLGCEMGISTQKLHARGPMGLKEMTSYKYVIVGDGQVR